MISIEVKDRSGNVGTISATIGTTLMEVLRDNGIDELLALCGGCCSCATCHVYVDCERQEPREAASSDEDDLLDSSAHRQMNSRLSCQLMLRADHDGLRVRIAPED